MGQSCHGVSTGQTSGSYAHSTQRLVHSWLKVKSADGLSICPPQGPLGSSPLHRPTPGPVLGAAFPLSAHQWSQSAWCSEEAAAGSGREDALPLPPLTRTAPLSLPSSLVETEPLGARRQHCSIGPFLTPASMVSPGGLSL